MIDHIRCSGLARPMACAGSLFFKDLPEQPTNEAARQGTAAGEYLEHLLNNLLVADIPTHAKNGVPFDDDMKFYATGIYEVIRDQATGPIACEARIDWQTQSGICIKGQYDCSYESGDKLYVDDYKYGWGIVEVKENWQLLGYAIGEVIRRGKAYSEIVLRIHQPRPHHEDGVTREWRLTYDELLSYKDRIETRMTSIANGEQSLTTSPKCRYCPAVNSCPAFNKSFFRGIEVTHDFLQDDIDEEEISFQLSLLARVDEVLKIKKRSLEELAVFKIKNGSLITNWISQTSYGNRKWKQDISPEMIKALTGKDIVEEVMLSPAKAEKIGVPKSLMKSMTDRPFLGQKLTYTDTSAVGDKIFGTK